ncbi:MAG TPA: hypothetical protein VNZ53_09400, partial [Steroidobacteraceae bacterium]|nr:hypothetical protein [Steroidobacteraceae bacterium]
ARTARIDDNLGRGTDGSNPLPSSKESANFRSLSGERIGGVDTRPDGPKRGPWSAGSARLEWSHRVAWRATTASRLAAGCIRSSAPGHFPIVFHDYWEADARPDFYILAVGAFADANFPPPSVSIFEESKHTWLQLPDGMKHFQGAIIAGS